MKRDAYAVLGVPKDCDENTLKKAYKKAAMKWHPDRHVNDSEPEQKAAEEKFKEVAGAYEVLCDPEKRAAYDQFGWEGLESGGMPPDGGSGFPGCMHAGGFGGFAGGRGQSFVFSTSGMAGGVGGGVDPMKLFASVFGDMGGGLGGSAMGGGGLESMFGGMGGMGGMSSMPSGRKRGRPGQSGTLQSGTRVLAHGLSTAALNGAQGKVCGQTASGRYTVDFPALGQSLAIKRENLLQLGLPVRLGGLSSQPQLNGVQGTLAGLNEKGDRYLVQLQDGSGASTTASFRRECVELQAGTSVVIGGLSSRPELNSAAGEVVELDKTAGRYVVALAGGQKQVKLKPSNLTV